jgi:ABC-type multidrug transport system ATPase subunit
MGTLELNNLNIAYNNNNVLTNFSMKLKKGDNLTILGATASGKTSLAKVIAGLKEYQGDYLINGVEIVSSNNYLVEKFVTLVQVDDLNIKVIDYLFNAFNIKRMTIDDEQKKLNEVIKYFAINSLLDKKLINLNQEHLYYILIIASLLSGHDYVIIDNILSYLNQESIKTIYNYTHKHKISIINFTTSLGEVLYSPYLIFIYDNKIAMEGETLACLKEETLLKRLGYSLPFIIDLSTQLCYYEIINKIYEDKESLVKAIWK